MQARGAEDCAHGGETLVNGEPQKRAGEVAAEVAIALALSDLRGAGRTSTLAALDVPLSMLGCLSASSCMYLLRMTRLFHEHDVDVAHYF